LVVLAPVGDGTRMKAPAGDQPDPRSIDVAWLVALGARVVLVEASSDDLLLAGSAISADTGLRLGDPSHPLLRTGLEAVIRELGATGHADSLLAVPALIGCESAWLRSFAAERRSEAARPSLGGVGSAGSEDIFGVVGDLVGAAASRSNLAFQGGCVAATGAIDDPVPVIAVTRRDAEAAQRLLAREEGLLTSRRGAAGLAALVRLLRDDRSRRPRERRLPQAASAVTVLTSDWPGIGDGPPLALDDIPIRPVSLAALVAYPRRVLVEPPGR
jgi:hypothetical protein